MLLGRHRQRWKFPFFPAGPIDCQFLPISEYIMVKTDTIQPGFILRIIVNRRVIAQQLLISLQHRVRNWNGRNQGPGLRVHGMGDQFLRRGDLYNIALVNNPDVILADEPSGSLDSHNKEELHKLFFDLRDRFGQTFIIVTHDEKLAQITDRTVHMIDGVVSDK